MNRAQRESNAKRRLFGRCTTVVILSVLVLATLATLIVVVWQKSTRPSQPSDYEGTIVDRWADYAESDQGSRPRLALVVESTDRRRFTIRVDPNVYESARVGMRIKSRSGQIVLIDSQQKATADR